MSSSGGFEKTNNNPIDNPNDVQEKLSQIEQAESAEREHKVDKLIRGETQPSDQQATARRDNTYEPSSPVRKSGRKPGEVSPELGQDSGTDWQESQQMGWTGHGGVQNPQTNS